LADQPETTGKGSRHGDRQRQPQKRHLAANGVEAEREKQSEGNRKHCCRERMGPTELGYGRLQIEYSAFVLYDNLLKSHVTSE
jgi:hypothetical protein